MAKVLVSQTTALTKSGAVWTVLVDERSGVDHPGYDPYLPGPPGVFVEATDSVGKVVRFERVSDADAGATRAHVLVSLIETFS